MEQNTNYMESVPNPFRFSILIPCYNYAHFLEECLQSVIEQTYGEWEAIVVDDASTVGYPQPVVTKFNDPRIHFFRHKENRGAGATFNTAFENSRYSHVFLLSADDKLSPEFLEKIRAEFINNPHADVIIVDFGLFGEAKGTWNYKLHDVKTMTLMQWIPGPASVMKRDVWEKAGGHYEGPELKSGNLDWDFWLSAVKYDLNVLHIPEPLYLYRVHNSSITSKRASEDYRIHEFMYLRHKELFDRFGTGNEFKAKGYLNTAAACWKNGDRLSSARFAHLAWKLFPVEIDVFTEIRNEFDANGIDIKNLRRELEQKIAFSPDYGLTPCKENVFTYRDLARLAAAQEDWKAAEMYLLHALAFMKNPALAAGLCNLLGLVYMKVNDLELASQALDLTLHHDPSNRGVFLHKANLYFKKELWKESLHVCLKGLDLVLNNHPLLVFLGKIAAEYEKRGLNKDEFNHDVVSCFISQDELFSGDECGCGSKSFLYNSTLGRKIYWISRAKDLYDKYGSTEGGYDTLKQCIESVSPRRLLEIGCGNGRNFPLYAMMEIEEVVGQDISNAALEIAQKRGIPGIKLIDTPITELDFPNLYFDLTVSNRVLQHIPGEHVESIIESVCRMSPYIYVNEATAEEMGNLFESFYMFIHDYPALFGKFGFKIVREMKVDNQLRLLFHNDSY